MYLKSNEISSTLPIEGGRMERVTISRQKDVKLHGNKRLIN